MSQPIGVDQLLAEARSALGERPTAAGAAKAVEDGALLVDIRSDSQRARDGSIPGAVRIARNALEWRADPASADRDERVADTSRRIVLFCDEGYASSLAAANLRRFGLDATDLDGGFQAWRAAGLAVEPPARG